MVKFGYTHGINKVFGGKSMLPVILLMIFIPFVTVIFSLLVASSRSNRMLDEFMDKNKISDPNA